ncbi:hypothetical protein [Kitasatospora cheerisanensis]|uniref:hypothetical protein n=1 Tax=Kitasatospora cheerisanensis TaxID=81942 RepID=UPI0005661234|nr:hypothetical protein [Kitasatospora cheerisanensis]
MACTGSGIFGRSSTWARSSTARLASAAAACRSRCRIAAWARTYAAGVTGCLGRDASSACRAASASFSACSATSTARSRSSRAISVSAFASRDFSAVSRRPKRVARSSATSAAYSASAICSS